MATTDIGLGMTVTFDSAYFAAITGLNWSGLQREEIPTWNFATTGGKTFDPSSIYDPGEIAIEFQFAPGTTPGLISLDDAETATITFTDTGTATWAASAWLKSLSINAGEGEARVMGSAVLRCTGDITIVP